ncbi:insulinase family protein [Thiohalospira sp.]|uniref:insulinase family protein n=1 Tax=Thiohalospira sp. TaxID=3080549 RepID=UPI00397FA2CD
MSNSPATVPQGEHHGHPAFESLGARPIEALQVTVETWRHRATGAIHYHIAADNPENVFLVGLRTMPQDSTGVAHILEHTVLCGSRNYPVRDPFFMMIRRSLNTFMNALTSSDWTAYPFASTNRKDFFNLLDVYLDAVFFANLDEMDFAQEGHRLEFEEPSDPTTPLVRRGVVYNEMKGAMSSATAVLFQELTRYLFPTVTYHHNSGGDPEQIPQLTHEQLRAFYASHYHPSNAVFMTFGDLPAAEIQARIEERALSAFQRLDRRMEVPDETRYHAPLRVEEGYAVEGPDTARKTHHVLGWLLGRSTDLAEQLRAQLLSGVLLDNSASPLRHALESSDLGTNPSPLLGVEDSNKEMAFVCGLEGSDPEHADAVERLVLETLEEVAREGVPAERVEAVLHQIEISQREIEGDGMPFGLQIILDGLSAAIHHGDPVGVWDLDAALAELRAEAADPGFIPRLVRERLLDNPHRVRLTLRPEPEIGQRREAAERAHLDAIAATLDHDQRQHLVERAAELADRQNREDDPELLPKVGIEDIPEAAEPPEFTTLAGTPAPASFYGQGTNGLVYQQVVVALPELEPELLDLLPLYTDCLTEVGVGERDYRETQAWQDAVTGGIHAYSTVQGGVADVQTIAGHLVLGGKALARHADDLAGLLEETLNGARFDEHDWLRDIVAEQRARQERAVTGQGHVLAMRAASAGMAPPASLTHRLRGLEGLRRLKALDAAMEEGPEAVRDFAERLAALHERIRQAPRRFLLVGEPEHAEGLERALNSHWPAGPVAEDFAGLTLPPVRETVQQLWVTQSQVSFCARAYPTVAKDHPDAAPLTALGVLLRNQFLHRAIREQGGAYGAGASQDVDNAAFRFFSYRDPRIQGTLNDFDAAVEWFLGRDHDWSAVEESILGVVSSLDKPRSPAGEARQDFHGRLYGRTPEVRQRFRDRVLAVRQADLERVAREYLAEGTASTAVVTGSFGAEAADELGLMVERLES